MVKTIKPGLIVSCQALPHEPLFGSKTMAKMAVAALEGGAVAIRANTAKDINLINKTIEGKLPIIGLVKKDYLDSEVYITATLKEVKELIKSRADIIALDATHRKRPNNESLVSLVQYIRTHSKAQIMADISTLEEALEAEKLGFEYISTTLRGYTQQTKDIVIPDVDFIKNLKSKITKAIVVAEGGIRLIDQIQAIKNAGVEHIVIGSAITRPQLITKFYVDLLENKG